MRRNFTTRCVLFCLLVSITAFTNEPKFKAVDLRLTRVETISDHGSWLNILQYDQSGRIVSISSEMDGKRQILFNVTYNGNRIILSRPATTNTESDSQDTIVLIMDVNNHVAKRIANQFRNVKWEKESSKSIQRYRYDSSTYQYDAAGRLIHDINVVTEYSKDAGVMLSTVVTNRTSDYTLDGSNLGTWKYVEIKLTTTASGSSEKSFISKLKFEYAHNYPFHTDFSNAAVLNEVHPFNDFPMNGGFASLPSGVTVQNIYKEENGSSTDQTMSAVVEVSYDDMKMVSSMKSSAAPDRVTRYVYERSSR